MSVGILPLNFRFLPQPQPTTNLGINNHNKKCILPRPRSTAIKSSSISSPEGNIKNLRPSKAKTGLAQGKVAHSTSLSAPKGPQDRD